MRENSPEEWDRYWTNHSKEKSFLEFMYDQVAKFYRKKLIAPLLHRVFSEHVDKETHILHAGSGAGEVDEVLKSWKSITALDFSNEALERYKKINPSREIINCNLLNLELKRTFDIIYNLGVMEHFERQDIRCILLGFSKAMNEGGKLVLFWPGVKSPSVIFLKLLHSLLRILRSHIELHPKEISLFDNRENWMGLFEESGFELISCRSFFRDAFTYKVVIARKHNSHEVLTSSVR